MFIFCNVSTVSCFTSVKRCMTIGEQTSFDDMYAEYSIRSSNDLSNTATYPLFFFSLQFRLELHVSLNPLIILSILDSAWEIAQIPCPNPICWGFTDHTYDTINLIKLSSRHCYKSKMFLCATQPPSSSADIGTLPVGVFNL